MVGWTVVTTVASRVDLMVAETEHSTVVLRAVWTVDEKAGTMVVWMVGDWD